ncbi:hypothetical protein RXV94_05690 [Yeosuana sp. MJ-SS3]|uniref:Transporter n=1 Tax=Gilvirhabdus luticola TaxID=3079858 RepID=A0ABU3U5F9_9FLAO|nr:hypothetical protein [Yeosuana sp. MJ-SS3]MDU8885643.1 hypothetical protein [Yeosuana sp. MJ-SS3]
MYTFKNFLVALIGLLFGLGQSFCQDDDRNFLRDRGSNGIPTSMFGTYAEKGDIILYPFYEYYYDKDFEYEPFEFGYGSEIEYRSKYTAHEGLIYFGLGISDWVMVELEAAVISGKLEKSTDDTSQMPDEIKESGLGDVEGQVRWRYNMETLKKPEYFSYLEFVFPFTPDKPLTGTGDWEFKLGSGILKGFKFGTMTFRIAAEYDGAEDKFELGEMALEYLRKVNDWFRFYIGVEGTQDEWELINDLQFHIKSWMFIRVNNAIGITSKATDYAPELGVVFYLNKI